jgi:ketosteroid isomerase-like protein
VSFPLAREYRLFVLVGLGTLSFRGVFVTKSSKEKNMNVKALLLPLILPLSAFAGPAEDEDAVWRLEESYWHYVKQQDLDAYRALWDERFVGWPSFSPQPIGKATIADWIAPLHQDATRVFDFELKREAVRSFGDIVVAHYLTKYLYRDAETGKVLDQTNWARFTHTWQRRGESWQIVTGMSASYDH